jgi:preprotein translocase subunit SecA
MSKITHTNLEPSQYRKPLPLSLLKKDTGNGNTVAEHTITDIISINNGMEGSSVRAYRQEDYYQLWQNKKLEDKGWYSDRTVQKIGNALIQSHGYQEDQFIDPADLDTINLSLSERKDKVPLFVIYNIRGNHWITFCVVKLESGDYKVLIKDSLNYNTDNLKKILRSQLNITDHDIVEHSGIEQTEEVKISCGAMALKNMSIIAAELKKKLVKGFCKDFKDIEFCKQADVQGIKAEYDKIYEADLRYVDDISKKLIATENVSELELEQFYKLIINNKLQISSKLLVILEELPQRLVRDKLQTELEARCTPLPPKEDTLKFARATKDRKQQLEQLRVGLPVKLLLKAIKDNPEYKPSNELIDELIKIISSKSINIESDIKQNAIEIVNTLVQRGNLILDEERTNVLIDVCNKHIEAASSTIGEKGQKFIISLLKLLQDKIKIEPKQFELIGILEKIAAIDSYPTIMEAVVTGIAQTLNSDIVISENTLIRIIESSNNRELERATDQIIAHVIGSSETEFSKKVLEQFKQIKFSFLIIEALKKYCSRVGKEVDLSRTHPLIIKALLTTSTNSDTTSGVLDIFNDALKYKLKYNIYSSEIVEFLKQSLIETDNVDLRLKAATILNTSDNYSLLPKQLQELLVIEQGISELSKNPNEILNKIKNYVTSGNKLTQSCFKLLQDIIPDETVLSIVTRVIDHNKQPLPESLTNKLYEQIKAGLVNDELVDIVTKLGQQGLSISAEKVIDVCLSIIDNEKSSQEAKEKATSCMHLLNIRENFNISEKDLQVLGDNLVASKNITSQSLLLEIIENCTQAKKKLPEQVITSLEQFVKDSKNFVTYSKSIVLLKKLMSDYRYKFTAEVKQLVDLEYSHGNLSCSSLVKGIGDLIKKGIIAHSSLFYLCNQLSDDSITLEEQQQLVALLQNVITDDSIFIIPSYVLQSLGMVLYHNPNKEIRDNVIGLLISIDSRSKVKQEEKLLINKIIEYENYSKILTDSERSIEEKYEIANKLLVQVQSKQFLSLSNLQTLHDVLHGQYDDKLKLVVGDIFFNAGAFQFINNYILLDNLEQQSPEVQLKLINALEQSVKYGEVISKSWIEQLEELIDDVNLTKNIVSLLGLIHGNTSLQEKTLSILINILNKGEDQSICINAINILASQIPYIISRADQLQAYQFKEIIGALENAANNKISKICTPAFSILNYLAQNNIHISDEFLNKYQEKLINNLDKEIAKELKPILDKKLNDIDLKLKYVVLNFLSNTESVYPEILQQEKIEDWITESLLQDILGQALAMNDELGVKLFLERVDNLRDYYRYKLKVVEDILVSLRKKQLTEQLSLADIASTIDFVQTPNYQKVLTILDGSAIWRTELRTEWLTDQLKNFNVAYTDNEIKELGYLLDALNWNKDLTYEFLHRISQNSLHSKGVENSNVGNFVEVRSFLEFLVNNRVEEICVGNAFRINSLLPDNQSIIKTWEHYIGSILVEQDVNNIFSNKIELIHNKLSQLLKGNCSYKSVKDLLNFIQEKKYLNIEEYFTDVLNIIYEYNLQDDICDKGFSLLKLSEPQFWGKEIHILAIKATFKGGQERDLDELIELIDKKTNGVELVSNKIAFKQKYENIISSYEGRSKVLTEKEEVIAKWTREDVEIWAGEVRGKSELGSRVTQDEMIAVVKRAVEIHNKFSPRTIQLLSLITLLNPVENKGRLAQINTGEGKSNIVAMFAAIKALQGNKVDVITSSTELSIPEVKKQTAFFTMLGLTVGENSNFSSDKKAVYKKDIVYGTAGDFQGDILRTEYLRMDIRGDRGFAIAIVDEVDSMLIDGRSNSIQLSATMPAMNHLEIALATIWSHIGNIERHLVSGLSGAEEQTFYVTEDFKVENGEITIFSGKNLEECLVPVEDKKKFIEEHTKTHLEKLLRKMTDIEEREWKSLKETELKISNLQDEIAGLDIVKKRNDEISKLQDIRDKLPEQEYQIKLAAIEKQYPKQKKEKELQGIFDNEMPALSWNQNQRYPVLEIPKHLQSFALEHIPHWIESALTAKYTYRRDRHYDVKDNQITPIDYSNTGVLQNNMVWSDGLCQFLQIKEGLKITPENLSTNFISNVEFFKRYKSNIYGLTGTLGSRESQKLLAEVYDTDTVIIPPYKNNEIVGNSHSKYICKELPAIITDKHEQWYEIICTNTLSKVRNQRGVLIICKYVDEVNQIEKLLKERYESNKIFTYTGQGNFEKEKIEAGEIIIATNIAGRGTDIKTSDVIEENGGLHVCVTFLPDNLRVELQNVGRTSREGHNGTAQLIIFDENDNDIDSLREYRDENEVRSIEKARQDVDRMLLRDELFKRFCQLQKEIFPDFKNSIFDRKGLEEQWAIWLRGVGDEINKANKEIDRDKVLEKFEKFSTAMKASDQIIYNPYYHVLKGNELLQKEQYEDAICEYDKAIKLNPIFSVNAHYNKACAILKNKGDNDSQRAAKVELEKAKELIKKHYNPNIISFHTLINLGASNPQISQQVQHQMNILGQQENYIDSALGVINKTLQKEWDVKIELTKLDEIFKGTETNHTSEINEAETNGLSHFFELTEQKPTPWWDIIGVALIGLGQILVGGLITVFSCGAAAQFGMGLISEGVSDLITAVKSGIEGDFSWEEWGIQKAISIAISVVTAGLGAIKTAAKAVGTFVKTAASKAAQFVTKEAGKQVVGQATKQGLKLAIKQVGLTLAKGVAKEAINQLVDYVADKTVLPLIEEEIAEKVEAAISQMLEHNEILQNALKLDQENKNNYWQNQLIQEGLEIINPKNNKWMDAIGSLATGIAAAKIKGAGKILQAIEMTAAVAKLTNFTDDFIKQFGSKLEGHKAKINKGLTDIEQNKKDVSSKVKSENKEDKSINVSDEGRQQMQKAPKTQVKNDDIPEVDIRNQGGYNSKQNKTSTAVNPQFYKPSKIEAIHSSFSSSITGQMMNTVKSKIVKPVTTGLVSAGVDKMAASAQKSISKDIESFQDARQIKFAQDKITKSTSNTKQFEPGIEASHISSDPEVNKMIKDVRSEGEGGLQHLGPLSKAAGRPIEIYDEKGKRIQTIGKKLDGKPIQLEYQKPGKDREQGHWKPLNGNELPSSGKNNCLFDAVSAYTGTPGSALRERTANELASNHKAYKNMMPAIQKLQQNGKVALYMGGVDPNSLRRDPKSSNPREALLTVYRGDVNGNLGSGFEAKDPSDNSSIVEHAADTKDKTKFISTTTDPKVALKYAHNKPKQVFKMEIPVLIDGTVSWNNDGTVSDDVLNIPVKTRKNNLWKVHDLTHLDYSKQFIKTQEKNKDFPRTLKSGKVISKTAEGVLESSATSKEVLIEHCIIPSDILSPE